MISQIVADAAPAGLHYTSTQGQSDGGARGRGSVEIPAGGTVALLLGIVLGVALTVVLAAASARSRRGDLATLAALGARPWTLRASPGVEAGATALVAAIVGTAAGAGAAILRAHPTLFHAGGTFDPATISQILWWNTSHVFWVYPLVMIAAATVASTIVGLLYGFEAQRRTPVEELREAVKEGSL
jgi:putative ABC transport system permease protein